MLKQLLLVLLLTGVTVIVHAVGTVHVVRPLSGIWSKSDGSQRSYAAAIPLSRLVSGLLLVHLFEMVIWAVAFTIVGMFPDFETSLYFSLKSYTTVGYGDVLPLPAWRLIGPLEAAVGVLMLGWSTGFIVAAVQQVLANRRPPPGS